MWLLLLLGTVGDAVAGSGPWVISEGDASFYGGTEFQRLTRLALSTGKGAPEEVDVDDGLETFGAKAILTYGLRDRIELEARLPWYRVEANTQGPICAALSLGACETTEGIGQMQARLKGVVVDELRGAPVSIALGAETRFGTFTSDTRQRITNIGEGTNDVGAFASMGRSGGLADGFWSGWVEGGWRHRFPNREFASVGAVPGDEFFGDAEFLAGSQRWWSLGPSLTWLWRPDGFDVEQLLGNPQVATSIDRWGALNISSLRVGGKLLLRSSDRVDFVAGVLTTVAAVNNPSDVLTVSVGVSVHPGPEAN